MQKRQNVTYKEKYIKCSFKVACSGYLYGNFNRCTQIMTDGTVVHSLLISYAPYQITTYDNHGTAEHFANREWGLSHVIVEPEQVSEELLLKANNVRWS